MTITETELKEDLGKYLALSSEQDIYITRNGTVVARLTAPLTDRMDMARSLFVILPPDVTVEQAQEERLDQV